MGIRSMIRRARTGLGTENSRLLRELLVEVRRIERRSKLLVDIDERLRYLELLEAERDQTQYDALDRLSSMPSRPSRGRTP